MDLMCECALRWINYWLHSVLICDHMMHHDESASKCDIDSQDEKEDVSMVLVTPVPASHTNSGHKADKCRSELMSLKNLPQPVVQSLCVSV